MLLKPAVEADYAAIVDLANLAFRGSGSIASWNTEVVFIEGQRLNESLLREDLAAKPEAQLLMYRDDPDGPLLGTVLLEERKECVWYLGLLTILRESTWGQAYSHDGSKCSGHTDCAVRTARV